VLGAVEVMTREETMTVQVEVVEEQEPFSSLHVEIWISSIPDLLMQQVEMEVMMLHHKTQEMEEEVLVEE